jgi:hypothetical protein
MPTMGSPIPHAPSLPASMNLSAGNAQEIVSMMRGIMDLAKSDSASGALPQASMPALGTSLDALLPAMGGGHDGMGVAQGDVDNDGDHDMGDHTAQAGMGASPVGGTDGAVDVDNAGDQEIMDLIKSIRTGQPVKITTNNPVKVSTDKDISGSTTGKHTSSGDDEEGGDEEGPEDEEYSNTPKPEAKPFDPNNMADLRDKVDGADKQYTPPGSGSNPLAKDEEGDSEEGEKKESIDLLAFEAQLFADYKKFVNEGGKKPDFLDMDKDGNKKEPMKKAVADKKKNPFGNKK